MGKLYALLGALLALAGLCTGVYFFGRNAGAEAVRADLQPKIDNLTSANRALDEANTLHAVSALTQNAALDDLRVTCEAAQAATKAEAAKVAKVAADRDAVAKQLRAARGAVSADQSCEAGLRIVRERMAR